MSETQQRETQKMSVVSVEDQQLETRRRQLLQRQWEFLSASGSLPKHIKSAAHLRMAYELLRPLGLAVVANLRNIWANPSTGSMELCNDAPLAACQLRRDEYLGTVEYHVNEKNERRSPENFVKFKAAGAVCIAKRRDKPDAVGMWTLDQSQIAGLMSKDNWRKYPEAMLTKRARAIALRLQWADVLQGVGIYEADEFVTPQPTPRGENLSKAVFSSKYIEGKKSEPQRPNKGPAAEPSCTEPTPIAPQKEDLSADITDLFAGDEPGPMPSGDE